MFKTFTGLRTIQDNARFLIPGTCTLMYYLTNIYFIRRSTGMDQVILDADHCILVL